MGVEISVVVPLYQSADTVEELVSRLHGALAEHSHEVVLVDDASPDDSYAIAERLASAFDWVTVVRHLANLGQHAALRTGILQARGEVVVTIDADLQDRPEDVPLLLAGLRRGAGAVVCGRRSGNYEGILRRLSGGAARTVLSIVSRGGYPADAGLFLAASRAVLVPAAEGLAPGGHLLARLARLGQRVATVPVTRDPRTVGSSSYRMRDRMRIARSALRTLRTDPDAHNRDQVDYFSRQHLPRMKVPPTPTVCRQVDAVLAAAGAAPAARVIEVGCGNGRFTQVLVDRIDELHVLDLTPALLDLLRSSLGLPAERVHCADVTSPPATAEGAFDAVIGFFMLHHLYDLPASFAGMARLLRPGGRVAFCEPNAWHLPYYAQIAFSPGMTWRGDRGVAEMRRSRLVPALRAAGFIDIDITHFGALPPRLANTSLGGRAERALEAMPGWSAAKAYTLVSATWR